MAKLDVVAGLDIGSAQVACVIGRRDPQTGQIEALSGARSACPGGLKGGVVINIDETARAVTRICEEAEDQAKEMVKDLTIAIRGTHLQTFNNHGALNIARTDKEITAEDVEKAIESAQAVHMSADREIIHTIPQGFTLDRQQGVPNPVGMEGSLLEVDTHIVTASRSHLNNIFKAINVAGFQVTEPIYGLLAAGEVVVTQEERDLGCLLLDIGGQTTDLAVYFDGSVHFTEKLPLGADAITRDLAYGLRTSLSQAQQIKENYGVAMSSLLEQNDNEVTFTAMDGRTFRKVSRRFLIDIVEPRVEEIFTLVAEKLQDSGYADRVVPGGLVLTGGGSLLKGIEQAAERILQLSSRVGLPQGVIGKSDLVGHPSFATAVGLLGFPYRGDGQWHTTARRRTTVRTPGSWTQKLKEWVEETF
jgi:cell division protein FtsA